MKPNTEAGIVIGNVEAKYEGQSPIARQLMAGFFNAFDNLVEKTGATDVHEIGCGEGYLSQRLANHGRTVRSCDFSEQIIQEANRLHGDADIEFSVRSIYDLEAERDSASLVICCEVLEHLETPESGFEKLAEITTNWCILSVPREPLWCVLNMMRGKYLGDRGNTPGYLQHWSKISFIRQAQKYFDVVETRSPIPWTMLLCRARS